MSVKVKVMVLSGGIIYVVDDRKCECGAFKVWGAVRGSPLHTKWCHWSKP